MCAKADKKMSNSFLPDTKHHHHELRVGTVKYPYLLYHMYQTNTTQYKDKVISLHVYCFPCSFRYL